ncbi:TolC family protein [Noviherbaspirillum sp. UKPF54]|uniref:TolC family protein n=1 Tax=Noviherbaspirillum sp. UKPF54 TaxID=2601898 RepID=UPI0011B0FBFC|nr:TolC family protein [Noviherbaspirillum sp. UKPF54]QDZ30285.1 TolC family protein [Noviherbaspirillum sp. UKPF54]
MKAMKLFSFAWPMLAVVVAASAGAQEYPPLLPPEGAVRNYLNQLPQVQAARNGIELGQANASRLGAGPYEWTVKGTLQQRRERAGPRYRENELAVERPVRWFGKADKDRALGEIGVTLAEHALADAWHEAGRAFLKNWFDTLRNLRAAARLQEQADLLGQQADVVRKRYKAGDAPRVELMLAETERDRALGAQRQAALRAERSVADLRVRYPGIAPQAPQQLPAPAPIAGSASEWQQRILAENHELLLARAQATQGKLSAERAALDRVPDPTIGVRIAQERDSQEKIVGLTLSIPLSGTLRRAQQDAGLAQARIAEDRARQSETKAQSDAISTAMNAESAYEVWQRLEQVARQTEANTAVVSKAYSLGEAPLGELLLARRQSLDAVASAEEGRFDALEAYARLLLDAHVIWDEQAADSQRDAAPTLTRKPL